MKVGEGRADARLGLPSAPALVTILGHHFHTVFDRAQNCRIRKVRQHDGRDEHYSCRSPSPSE